MKMFPVLFSAGTTCPPVVHVIAAHAPSHPARRVTVIRHADEAGADFGLRTQQAAREVWASTGQVQDVRIECVYRVPSRKESPYFFDDEFWADVETFRRVLRNPLTDTELRSACADALKSMNAWRPTHTWE